MSIFLNISHLMARDLGYREELTLEIPVFEDSEIQIQPKQSLDVVIYRIQDGLAVVSQETTLKAKAQCVVTLKDFILEYPLLEIESQFYWDLPEGVNPEEVEMIDKKNYQIDLENLVREAVFLSLPSIIKSPEASEKFKEIPVEEEAPSQTPFANLKDLLEE